MCQHQPAVTVLERDITIVKPRSAGLGYVVENFRARVADLIFIFGGFFFCFFCIHTHRSFEFIKKTSHIRIISIGAFLVSIPIFFTGKFNNKKKLSGNCF